MWCNAHTGLAILITLFWEVLFSRYLQFRMQFHSHTDAEQPVCSEKQQAYNHMQVVSLLPTSVHP